MTNNTNLVDEILSSIDEMDSITMESSLDVMNSLLDSYDKILTIQENYEGDVDDFETIMESFYQEGKIMDEVKEMGKDQGMIMRIISFIPRLLIAIGRAIKNAWKGGEPAKKASSAAERVMKWGQDVKDFATSLFTVDKDNTGKIVGITVAGVAISGAVVASWIAARKGIFEKLGNSFKSFWTNKVAAFFSKGITPEDVPSEMKDVGHIHYTDSTDKWTTLFNLDAVLKFFTEPKAIIENIGRISAIGGDKDSIKVYDEYLTKLDNVRKLKIISKNPVSFSTADINKYFKDIDAAITSLGDTAEKSWDNANKLLRNAKEGDLKNVDKNALKKFEEVVKTLGVYAGIVPGLVKFVGEFGKAYDDLIVFIEGQMKKVKEQASNGESNTIEGSSAETTNEKSATESKEPEQESTGDGKATSGSEEEKSSGTPETSVQSEIESKKQEVLDEYKQWRDKNPNATTSERNAMRNKIAMAKGFSKKQAKKIVVEFTTLYGTLEFGDNVYQESMIDECYDIDTTDVTSNGWYSR